MRFKNLLIVAFSLMSLASWGQTQVIAHRGFWKAEHSAQNSITSLKSAVAEHVYGSEFDVQLTADNVMVVNHDDNIQGLEISATPYMKLRNLRLKNGERLSTLKNYLLTGKKLKNIQLILEVKPQSSLDKENLMAELIVKMVRRYKLENQVDYISFSLNFCKKIVQFSPKSNVAYLGGDLSPKEVNDYGINTIDYNYKTLMDKPEWIKEAHELGMKVNAWTVNDEADMRKLINLHVDYLTTDYPVKALNLTRKP